MKRCNRCILPETYPGINFNDKGICNFCLSWKKVNVKGEEALEQEIAKYRGKGRKYDCMIAISGGRDSTFALYQFVKKYGMKPLAVTCDDGLVTDYAYPNIKRATNRLGVDHIFFSFEQQKVFYDLKKNLLAWLKKPSLAMIPIFTASDKSLVFKLIKLANDNGVELIVTGTETGFEDAYFKTGFIGINKSVWDFNVVDGMYLLWKYCLEYIKNPRYFNSSLVSMFRPYVDFFRSLLMVRNHGSERFINYYSYKYWNESEIMETIRREPGWESPTNTIQTWRTDDLTMPWYNFIYFSAVGFTENDTLLSSMIREGQIAREEALRRVEQENKPQYEEIDKYLKKVGVEVDLTKLERQLKTLYSNSRL